MISIAIFILILAFYLFYNTSKRIVKTPRTAPEIWVKDNPKSKKIIGFVLLIISLLLHFSSFGVGAGTLIFCIVLMTFGSLIILLSPLRLINYKTLLLFFVVSISLELFII